MIEFVNEIKEERKWWHDVVTKDGGFPPEEFYYSSKGDMEAGHSWLQDLSEETIPF